jgi:hypothetical protein
MPCAPPSDPSDPSPRIAKRKALVRALQSEFTTPGSLGVGINGLKDALGCDASSAADAEVAMQVKGKLMSRVYTCKQASFCTNLIILEYAILITIPLPCARADYNGPP